VRLIELRLENLRNIESLQLQFAPGLNLLTGPNGAGKTSILEAAYLLSRAYSFRTRQAEHLLRRHSQVMSVYGQVEHIGQTRRLGLLRQSARWEAKVDGQTPSNLSVLLGACAVVCFEPGSHALISGAAELRRNFLDWGVFHVEHDFAPHMRRYRRAVRQRNILLKQSADLDTLAVWDEQLIVAGTFLAEQRKAYVARLAVNLGRILTELLPELGEVQLRYAQGWDADISLDRALLSSRDRDRAVGHTTRGPHRADWSLIFPAAPSHEQLSRGQEKLCAIGCLLAQTELYREFADEWPIIALDDLCSELDLAHQTAVLDRLIQSGVQILLTGTEIPQSLLQRHPPQVWFHVEHGQVRAAT
jgi:DNA replication and repair protein RecF